MTIRFQGDFNGLIDDMLCLSHADTCPNERGVDVALRDGMEVVDSGQYVPEPASSAVWSGMLVIAVVIIRRKHACPKAGTSLVQRTMLVPGPDEWARPIAARHSERGEDPQVVNITYDFWLSDREITIELFQKFMSDSSYKGQPTDWPGPADFLEEETKPKWPVQQVSWLDAVMFCNWLSVQYGLEPCYKISKDTLTMTEAWANVLNPVLRPFGLYPRTEPITRVDFSRSANGFRLPPTLRNIGNVLCDTTVPGLGQTVSIMGPFQF